MGHLPVELMWKVCFNLCMHCHSPDALPHADTTDERQAKAALARLARSSKYMHAVAQPYIFHYYATGNMIRLVVSEKTGCAIDLTDPYGPYADEFGKGCRPSHDNDHLPLFLRSIIRRPELAAQVEALQLVASPNVDDFNAPDMEVISGTAQGATAMSRTSEAFQMITKASVDIGLIDTNVFHPEFRGRHSVTSGVGPPNHESQTDSIHHTLEQLVILLCPNVNTLVYGYPLEKRSIITADTLQVDRRQREQFWSLALSSGQHLTSLKRIALLSHSRTQHVSDGQIMLCSMPNVETFYAAHLTYPGPATETIGLSLWVNPMPNVRKLVAVDMSPDDLAFLVDSCLDLWELEYTHHGYFGRPTSITGCELLKPITAVRGTLRRLVLVAMAEGDPRGDRVTEHAIPSLRMFKRLEELAISQIHVPHAGNISSITPGISLAKFLPRSIKKLHILYLSDASFMAALEGLARDAPSKVPKLRCIRISYLDHEDPDYDSNDRLPVAAGQYERVRESLAAVSISMTWDRLGYRMPREVAMPAAGGSACSGTYLSTPYCFWEASHSLQSGGVLS
ncbi:uncharacterized protein B0H64DRAFT_937 [Chaetomium fimeti]|uniref:Uncharacterized protein n=1 Tax=Chaetomium fimeti TaxID=1854472 RepID=A0AAE0LWA7_9PEZI|nr:hypothetical protein B0H64DRAFT_937 [Chaetomium fimeti]